jgi:hypothetical protein
VNNFYNVPRGTKESFSCGKNVIYFQDKCSLFLRNGGIMRKVEFFKKYWPMVLLVLFSGCDTTESTLGGAALGTAAGLGVGHALGKKGGAAAGAVLGGLGGAAIGHHVGREGEEKKALSAENAQIKSRLNSNQSSRKDDELYELQREVELKRLKNEKLEQELERKRLKKEQRALERGI